MKIFVYLIEYKPQFGGNSPLDKSQVAILDDNFTFLTENIETENGLLELLVEKEAITLAQMDFLYAQAEACTRSEALLVIIRQGSQSQYERTIEALKASNQERIADVLVYGGSKCFHIFCINGVITAGLEIEVPRLDKMSYLFRRLVQ